MSGNTLIFGVLNVTPDSFSDGGQFQSVAEAVDRGIALVQQGADVLDVGGESTRPGASPVSPEEELRRVLPVVSGLVAQGCRVSIDTMHAETAAAAVQAGASFINDVSGGTHDPMMLQVAAKASQEHGVGLIVGHWRGIPDPAEKRSSYHDVVAEVSAALAARAQAAALAGVNPAHP